MDESDRKRSRLEQVRDFCADTTAHGLGRVATAKSWPARLFWIVILITASVISIYQISASITTYLEYSTKTDVSIVIKEQLRFPAVTVCNINPFKQSEIEKTPFWRAKASFFCCCCCNFCLFYHNFCITIIVFSYRTLLNY